MKLKFLLVAWLTYCSGGNPYANFFRNFTLRHLSRSINPCDDFFGHVCSEAPEQELFSERMSELMISSLANYSKHCSETLSIYMNLSQRQPTSFPNIEAEMEEILKTCKADLSRCQKLLQAFYEQPKEGLHDVAEQVYQLFEELRSRNDWNSETERLLLGMQSFCLGEALFRKVNTDATFRKKIQIAEDRFEQLVNKLKTVLVRRFEDTKWMQQLSRVKYYQNTMQSIKSLRFFNKTWEPIAAAATKKIHIRTKKCAQLVFGWHPMEIQRCIGLGVGVTMLEMGLTASSFYDMLLHLNVAIYNAFYEKKRNIIGAFAIPTMVTLAEGIAELASTGFILAHEMSHSIFFLSATEILNLPMDNIYCIKNHRENICMQVNHTCYMGNVTITEDVPDIMGLAAILDLFNEEKSQLNDNPDGFTKEKYFFYALTETFCTHELDHQWVDEKPDEHSPRGARLNALLMHSETFQNAFQCKRGDKMWREPSNFCHLLGPDASRR